LEEQLSAGAARVLAAARAQAASRNSASVEARDLFAALVSNPDLESNRLLAAHCELQLTFAAELSTADDPAEVGLDPFVRQTFAKARHRSWSRPGDREISTEDLLVVLIGDWEEADDELRPFGFSRDSFENATRLTEPERIAVEMTEPGLALDVDAEVAPRSRLMDANLNRASEGFRVVEDFARFVLEDRNISERLKRARHNLQDAAAFLPVSWRIASRDSPNDVGAELTTEREGRRDTMIDVATANIKRVQEALRSLEEAAKIDNSLAARQFGTIRYEAYHLEKLLLVATNARQVLATADVYWLAEPDACRKTFEWTSKEVMDAGVNLIQLRQKGIDDRTLFNMARDLRRWTNRFGARLIINDRADIARLVGADGVHVGQEDLPATEVRKIVGPHAMVGVSTHSLAQLAKAVNDGADYVGVGPVFPSKTKDFREFPGLDFVAAATAETSLPAFCIGGITPHNIERIVEAGGTRVAVSRTVTESEDPSTIVRRLKSALA
jgi:thiamine-phosphate pyrophosphorylase